MIDLRSDTLTKPTLQMMRAISKAELGDDGRINSTGKGEDPTVNRLERTAAQFTGKEDALFCNSGTMANLVALLTHTNRNEAIGIDRFSHIYQSEKSIFLKEFFGRKAVFYESDNIGKPLLSTIDTLLKQDVAVLCLENTLGNKGGTCLSAEETILICQKASLYNLPVHLDGARIFNAASHYKVSVKELVAPADSVQFCLSKGLGAPMGSILCGTSDFIAKARKNRKLIGGGMRQAGIIAAAGIVALQNVDDVHKDNEKTLLLRNLIIVHEDLFYINEVQSNIIILDLSPGGLLAQNAKRALLERGLKVKVISECRIRMTVYKEITESNIRRAAAIINLYFEEMLTGKGTSIEI